jgi:hypothetical protein
MVVALKTREELIGVAESGDRERELVRLIGRHGAMAMDQVMQALGTGRSVTYRRFSRLEDAGLVERLVIPGVGSVLHATRDGIRFAGLPLPVASVSAGNVEHTLRCASVAIRLGSYYGHDSVLTEREIIAAEALEETPIASTEVGEYRGRPKMHRADLAVLREQGTLAIEVELTPKSPRRLEGIVRAWRSAVAGGTVAEVHYVCAAGQTCRAVKRALARIGAPDCILIAEVPR